MLEETSSNQSENLCIICIENERDTRLECGHSVCCEDCVKKLPENVCPTCRHPMKKYWKMEEIHMKGSFINPDSGQVDWGKIMKLKNNQGLPRLYRFLTEEMGVRIGTFIFCMIVFGYFCYGLDIIINLLLPIPYIVVGGMYKNQIFMILGVLDIIGCIMRYFKLNKHNRVKYFYNFLVIFRIILYIKAIYLFSKGDYTTPETVIILIDIITDLMVLGIIVIIFICIIGYVCCCATPGVIDNYNEDIERNEIFVEPEENMVNRAMDQGSNCEAI